MSTGAGNAGGGGCLLSDRLGLGWNGGIRSGGRGCSGAGHGGCQTMCR
jgi:hypothetical protein